MQLFMLQANTDNIAKKEKQRLHSFPVCTKWLLSLCIGVWFGNLRWPIRMGLVGLSELPANLLGWNEEQLSDLYDR